MNKSRLNTVNSFYTEAIVFLGSLAYTNKLQQGKGDKREMNLKNVTVRPALRSITLISVFPDPFKEASLGDFHSEKARPKAWAWVR